MGGEVGIGEGERDEGENPEGVFLGEGVHGSWTVGGMRTV